MKTTETVKDPIPGSLFRFIPDCEDVYLTVSDITGQPYGYKKMLSGEVCLFIKILFGLDVVINPEMRHMVFLCGGNLYTVSERYWNRWFEELEDQNK